MYNVEFTKEELDILIIQIGARIDALKAIQLQEAKNGNVKRVVELEKGIELINSGCNKMMQVRYKK